MKKTFHALIALLLFCMIIFYGPFDVVASGIAEKPPIRVIVVSGTNYEMGVQYGEQAADLIAANRDITWQILETQVTAYPGGPPLGRDVILKDIQVWTYYLEKYDPALREWLLGISQGCKNKGFDVNYADLVAIMVYPQEVWARPEAPYPPETGVTAKANNREKLLMSASSGRRPKSSCSSFAATRSATPDNKPMVSITGGAMLETDIYVVLIAFPNNGHRFISMGQAGRVASNFGMNDKYGWVMPAAVTDPRDCPSSWGVTSEVYFHYLLQYCKSPSEAVKYLERTPRGGVTGIFVFADHSGEVFIYETGSCASAVRYPGKLGETDFVVSTNHYNDPSMIEYNLKDFEDEVLGFPVFPDTYPRYDTVWQKLSAQALEGKVDLEFTKALWAANDWYDVSTKTWYTVPVPNDFSNIDPSNGTPYICYVPGNLCEGGEYQVVQFPSKKTVYLQFGNPQGTSITNYWPKDPKPTGEYMKWQLLSSISHMASAASEDTLEMIQTAWNVFIQKSKTLDPDIKKFLRNLLIEATQAWWKATLEQKLIGGKPSAHNKHSQREQMARWGKVYTNYAAAQLYSQMVITKLKQY